MSDLASLLLPCPFCGGDEPRLTTNTHAGMSWVACLNCGLEAPSETGVSAEDAVTYWNRRSPPIKAGDAVPVAMVADRLAAWFNSLPDGGMGKEHFDALLSIAASPQPESYGVRVKPIKWGEAWSETNNGYVSYDASTIACHYAVYRIFDGGTWKLEIGGRDQKTAYATEDEAKAAAQADYSARIIAALEPTP